MQTQRQSPLNSNESIEDIKQNSQTADVLRCLKRTYGGILLNMFPVQLKKNWNARSQDRFVNNSL